MNESEYQIYIKKLNDVHKQWIKKEGYYTQVKGVTYISLNSNNIKKKRILSLRKEIEMKNQLINQLSIQRDYLLKLNYINNEKIKYLQKRIRKLSSREDTYKRINSIENPREKVQALINFSEQTYSHLNEKISKYMSVPKVQRKIQFTNGTVLTLHKNGTYYYEPDDTYFQNLQYLFLSLIFEPGQNEKEKVKEILHQFDFSSEDIDFITQKYISNTH